MVRLWFEKEEYDELVRRRRRKREVESTLYRLRFNWALICNHSVFYGMKMNANMHHILHRRALFAPSEREWTGLMATRC